MDTATSYLATAGKFVLFGLAVAVTLAAAIFILRPILGKERLAKHFGVFEGLFFIFSAAPMILAVFLVIGFGVAKCSDITIGGERLGGDHPVSSQDDYRDR